MYLNSPIYFLFKMGIQISILLVNWISILTKFRFSFFHFKIYTHIYIQHALAEIK